MSKSFAALCILMGTVVGAGILGLPYVVMKSGFAIGVFHIVFLAVIMAVMMLYLGEIALRTKSTHQLPGYAQKYLGLQGKRWMFIALAFGIYSAIIAYLIGEGRSLSYLIFDSGAYQLEMGILFWLFLSAITYFGIKALEEGEMVGVIFVFIMIIAISVFFANKVDPANLMDVFPTNFFAPFGVALFAFLGFAAIPEIERVLGKDKKPMRNIIIFAYALIALIYIIFTAIVLGYRGDFTPEVATIALGKPFIVLGMITMFTAYLSLSVAMIDAIRFDYKQSRARAWFYTIIVPLLGFIVLSLTGSAAFTKVLGIGGALSGGLAAIMILFMVRSAKKKGDSKTTYSMPYSDWIAWPLIIIFVLGALMEVKNILS